MIFWVKGEAVDMPCDQRAELVYVNESNTELYMVLCGTGHGKVVDPKDLRGMELSEKITLRFPQPTVVVDIP